MEVRSQASIPTSLNQLLLRSNERYKFHEVKLSHYRFGQALGVQVVEAS
jgi:hypothetical protein